MVTPTRDEIRAKALAMYMGDQYKAGLTDIPTPEDDELKEENYWLRAQRELMTSPEAKAADEMLAYLEMSASQLEEVVVKSEDLKELLEATRSLESVEEKLKDLRRKRKKEAEQAKLEVAELERKLEEERAAKPPPTLEDLRNYFAGLTPYDGLVKFIREYGSLRATYLIEDLKELYSAIKENLDDEDIFLFYDEHPELKEDLISVSSLLIDWIPPPPPAETGLTKEQKTRLEDAYRRVLLEAGVTRIPLAPFRDEMRVLQEDLEDVEREKAFRLAEGRIISLARTLIPRRPPPPPEERPPPKRVPIVVPPVELLGPRRRITETVTCWNPKCDNLIVIDRDLQRRVTLIPIIKAIQPRGVRHEALLTFPIRFYYMCETCRDEKFGYRSIYDALAYLLFESRSSTKRLAITKGTFEAVGLDMEDITNIQVAEARWMPKE